MRAVKYIYMTTVYGFERDCDGSDLAIVEAPDGFEKVSETFKPAAHGTPERPHYYSAQTLTILWRREIDR